MGTLGYAGGSKDKKVRRYAIVREQSSRKINFHPLIGKLRIFFDQYPLLLPCLIRDGNENSPKRPYPQSKHCAFTLAEVLITLGIIGVVAAMTIPSLITKHQKSVFATRVKQTYSIISNALITSVAENGEPDTWDYGDSVENVGQPNPNDREHVKYMAEKYIIKYLKVVQKEIDDTPCYLLSNGTTLYFMTDGPTDSSGIYSPDSLYIVANVNKKNCENYQHASRNYSRSDIFLVVEKRNKSLRFFKWTEGSDTERNKIKNYSKYGCNKNVNKNLRYNCGALIQYDGWEILDDYPW